MTKHNGNIQANILPDIEHENSIAKQLNQKEMSILHLTFHRLTVKCCSVA